MKHIARIHIIGAAKGVLSGLHVMFVEAFFVASLFLDICIEVFGAWVNHKNISNWDIFKEDTAIKIVC